MDETVEVGPDGIRLGRLLKLVGVAETGGAVKDLLADGLVQVNGVVETRRGAQLSPGDVVTVGQPPDPTDTDTTGTTHTDTTPTDTVRITLT